MSRIGKKPIPLPSGVKINVGEQLEVTGPKGKLLVPIPEGITFEQTAGKLEVKRDSDQHAALHGLTRALAANAVQGVSTGFVRELDIVGIGQRGHLHAGLLAPHRGPAASGCGTQNRQADSPGAERVRPAVAGPGGGKHSRASLAGSL
jgi:hypothetical protein